MCSETGTGRQIFKGSPCEVGTPGLHRCPASHWAQEAVMDFAEAPPTSQNEIFHIVLDSPPIYQIP